MGLPGVTTPEVSPGGEGRKPFFPGANRVLALVSSISGFLAITAIALVAAVSLGPLVLPYRTFIVLSPSMAPNIPTGSLVVDQLVDARSVRAGDIISFPRPGHPGETVTHRVASITAGTFTTKGDANATADSATVPISGRVPRLTLAVRLVGYPLVWLRTPAGLLTLLTLFASYQVARVMRRLWAAEPINLRGQPASP